MNRIAKIKITGANPFAIYSHDLDFFPLQKRSVPRQCRVTIVVYCDGMSIIMERDEHCVIAVANQSGLDAWIQALWAKNESFVRQADQLRSDRDDEDLEELVSDQREDEQIDTKRKAEDEDRIASRKRRYEKILKKRKVEDEGHERLKASLIEEMAVSWLRYSTTEI
jgi:hypothetical protein